MEDNHIDLKLDLVNWLNNESTRKEQFFVLYHHQETGEIITAISDKKEYLISALLQHDMRNKDDYRNFILNAAANLIEEYPDDYLQPMKEFVNSFKK